MKREIPLPSPAQVQHYLDRWEGLENYREQEAALDKLFHSLCPYNKDVHDILLKASALNDFYSTNIFDIYSMAKHIHALDIDERLQSGDVNLVDQIKMVTIKGVDKNFYSFASKYCSHHNDHDYPIYDSYVDRTLNYFRREYAFSQFESADLKQYATFKSVLEDFRKHFSLDEYNLKQIDRYLWQLGKDYFPKNYGRRRSV